MCHELRGVTYCVRCLPEKKGYPCETPGCGGVALDFFADDRHVCERCRDKEQRAKRLRDEGAKILSDLDAWLITVLTKIGLSPREVKADIDKVPMEVKRILPKEPVRQFIAGEKPSNGWGIGGNTGGGKSMAQAAMLKGYIKAFAKANAETMGDDMGSYLWRRICWVSWPDEVNWMRANATSPEVQPRIESLMNCRLLILDDLGRERIRGSYADDWAASQLDGILNHRYRNEMLTLWTTNVDEMTLAGIYGAAMLSRLTADNPLCWADGLMDQRGKR